MNIDLELVIKLGALLVSLVVLIKGIYEYTKAQKWKKAEFVSKEIKDFYNDFDIKRALILLDWNSNDIELKTNEIEGKSKLYFTDDLIVSSLRTHKESPAFTDEEVIIKAIFDSLLDRLTMFDNYIEAGLINVKDIKPYLVYWINILANPQNDRKTKEVRAQMWKYMDEYGYDKIGSLCAKFRLKHT